MLTVMLQMALLIAFGTLWQRFAPAHISAIAHRRALSDLVFFILLPALVLDVIWRAPMDETSMQISLSALSGLLIGGSVMALLLLKLPATRPQKGALILAAAFPNCTYMGLPVTDQVLGSWSNSVVLQYDLFACTPALMIVGILLAQHFGSGQRQVHLFRELLKIPPLWAVAVALTLNFTNVPQPSILHNVFGLLSGGVVPLMLIVLGMSIRWESMRLRFLPLLLPITIISLFIVPSGVAWVSEALGATQQLSIALVIISAMPTMVFGIVICERYHLDTGLYAAAVTFTTVLSMISLPLWYQWLSVN